MVALLILALEVALATAAAQPARMLTVDGDRFLVHGKPQFLIVVSYFDALRVAPAKWDADLAWLAGRGVSGVRIFPNWWHYCPTLRPAADDAVIGATGAINEERLKVLRAFLAAARKHGLVVDVSFTRETVDSKMPAATYSAAVAEVVRRLRDFDHVLVDIQNEWNKNGFTAAEMKAARDALKAADPNRLVTASTEQTYETPGTFAANAGMDVVAHHDPRGRNWFEAPQVGSVVAGIRKQRAGRPLPTYLQEPKPVTAGCRKSPDTDPEPAHARVAVAAAKASGAAAWTFHSRSSFDLSGSSLLERMTAAERTALAALRGAADKAK